MRRFTLEEIVTRLSIELPLVERFEEEGVIRADVEEGGARFYSEVQIERLRVARNLADLGVNDEGIEVILEMRDRMLSLHQEVAEALTVVRESLREGDDGSRHEPRRISVRIVDPRSTNLV